MSDSVWINDTPSGVVAYDCPEQALEEAGATCSCRGEYVLKSKLDAAQKELDEAKAKLDRKNAEITQLYAWLKREFQLVEQIRAERDAALAELKVMQEALVANMSALGRAKAEEGYCCCGDPIESHNMGSGHSPVDIGSYNKGKVLDMGKAALNQKGTTGE